MKPSIITIAIILLASCSGKENPYDATGTFEAVETIVPAEVAGTIQVFNVSEGVSIAKGATVGYIDSIQLYLKKKQVLAQIRSVLSKRPDVATQLAALEEQLRQAEKEMQRIARLLKSDAATQKQYDDASTQVKIIERQVDAQTSTLGIATASLTEETLPLRVQIEQLNDQLSKCRIVNPVAGTVLTKYAEAYEMTAVGKPLYKIADLSTIILRAYVTGE